MYKAATGTGGLTAHFMKHPGLMDAGKKDLEVAKRKAAEGETSIQKRQKLAGIKRFLTNKPLYDDTHPKQEDFDKWFILWMAKSYAPLRSTEDKWFRRMIHCLDPQIKFRNRKQMRSHILPAFVMDYDLKVKESLANAVAVVVCFDLWMSRGAQVRQV